MDSYDPTYVTQTDVSEWCKCWILSATSPVGGNIFKETSLVEGITLPRQQPSPNYTTTVYPVVLSDGFTPVASSKYSA